MAGNPWRDGWFCVGPAQALAEDGDHLSLDLPGCSVTIQNFRGTIAGFLNVCSHRATQMRPRGRGNGLLRCPYHGWVYNQKGIPVGIPDNDQLFQLTPADRDALALPSVAVTRRGALLFLRLDHPEGPSLGADVAGAGMRLAAERVATLDLAWTEILALWVAHAEAPSGKITAPNLVTEESEGWLLARYVVPATPTTSLVGAALFHPEKSSPDSLPETLSRIWRTTLPANPS